jgi:hypothetical protein
VTRERVVNFYHKYQRRLHANDQNVPVSLDKILRGRNKVKGTVCYIGRVGKTISVCVAFRVWVSKASPPEWKLVIWDWMFISQGIHILLP